MSLGRYLEISKVMNIIYNIQKSVGYLEEEMRILCYIVSIESKSIRQINYRIGRLI